MSDNEKDGDPDYEPQFTTMEMGDIQHEGDDNVCEVYESQGSSMPSRAADRPTEIEIEEERKYYVEPYKPRKPKKDRRTSLIWTKFTIINKKDQIAACNICDQRMSIRSTSGNLKKHLERKHGFSIKLGVLPHKRVQPKLITPSPRPKLSQLAGISDEGITVKVVGENGEEEHFEVLGEQYLSEEVVQGDAQEHDYTTIEHHTEEVVGTEQMRVGNVRSLNDSRSSHSKRDTSQSFPQPRPYAHLDDKAKRKRIMELQMDCLENKKYNMQLEALLMEQQLNLPRSIFTQPLRFADVQTRGTQTEVGGSDTKVFYITDRRGGRSMQQLFSLQEDIDDY